MKPLYLILLLISATSARADEPKPLDFQEVYSLIKTNLQDLPSEDLSRMAALALIRELGTKVQLVTTNENAAGEEAESLGRRAVYSDNYGYVAVKMVDQLLPEEFSKTLRQLNGTNALKGLVIDVRYARGQDYEAAAKVVDLFVKSGETLLTLAGKPIQSTEKSHPLDFPVAVLVNGETRGAAEALAAALRETGAGLVIGSRTAGEARLFETFTLSTGQKLRIGKIPVEAGSDHKAISSKGLTPDIPVTIDPANEKLVYQDPYRSSVSAGLSGARTNEITLAASAGRGPDARARRFNEAELVRRHREAADGDFPTDTPDKSANAERPVISDPALARGLDFLKGIAVLEHRPR